MHLLAVNIYQSKINKHFMSTKAICNLMQFSEHFLQVFNCFVLAFVKDNFQLCYFCIKSFIFVNLKHLSDNTICILWIIHIGIEIFAN